MQLRADFNQSKNCMKAKKFVLLLLLMFSVICMAYGDNFQHPFYFTQGSWAKYSQVSYENLPEQTSPDQQYWNFPQISNPETTITYEYKDPKDTEYDEIEDLQVVEEHSNNQAMLFKQDKHKTWLRGMVEPNNEILITFQEPIPLYKRPIKKGDSLGSKTQRNFSFRGFSFTGNGYHYTKVQEQGSLVINKDTIPNALKIKTVQDYNDEGPLGIDVETYVESYSWITPDNPFPVVTIDSLYRNDPIFEESEVNLRIIEDFDLSNEEESSFHPKNLLEEFKP